ncbi:hypothetical protein HanRHA438_Chr17g0803791 [Helianthus annuus]|uniref:DUF4283 domain-containing protein n=1 Tax=Helianthus annuus TaxID=4232 RepID=A0A9K3DFS7_HELAN|nr:hypothetical protein HanXRQr2_Chr17g0793651 [Helianthus annuus]KAJ0428503.1 hypothetical protein HanHA300_Chr17g0646861 [Helianthus annuus]KAJ0432601.1 hypothetical protein HanIR_Chr17g0861021 [Helianthus annuus]KAJ0446843.1 hypothetical protein HanHA89_Chr17g0698761 [Helianthus annuus]KAJ0631737.1 hypothetical protein HanLR1_Chr17g0657311 [Helianthus annuus]
MAVPKTHNDGYFNGNQSQNFRVSNPNPLGTSYKDSLMGSSKGSVQAEKIVVVSDFAKSFEDWFGRSLITRVADLTTLVKLDKLLSFEEGPKISLKYVGGLYMLLIFESSEEMYSFKDGNSFVKSWFSWLEIWNGQSLPFERIAWLKITGVSLHLLDVEVFDSVGRIFGKVIHASSISKDIDDLTYNLVGVLVGDGAVICESVTLKWKDRKFKVWVSEETGDWVPDCISDGDSWEEKTEKTLGQDLESDSDKPTSPENFDSQSGGGDGNTNCNGNPKVSVVEEVGAASGSCMGEYEEVF